MTRTAFDVCLVAVSESSTLAELSARPGVEPSDGSHDAGDAHLLKSRGTWTDTVWQCAAPPPTTSLEEKFEAIARRLPAEIVQQARAVIDRVYISVGVFSDAQVPTADLTPRCLAIAAAYGAAVEVKVYAPVDMDS